MSLYLIIQLDNYCNKLENESINYYIETGELDEYAKARLEHIQYEKYAEQFEIVEQDDDNSLTDEVDEDEDYLEDEYN